MPVLPVALLLLVALVAAPASAQSDRPPPLAATAASVADSTEADSSQVDSTVAPRLTGLLRTVGMQADAQREAERQLRIQEALERAARPRLHAFGSGLKVTLPPGWDGPADALDQGPGRERYTFRNDAPGHPLAGAILRVERVGGLNPLEREQWVRGQTPYGYNGTRPVGPAAAPLAGLALEVEGAGQGGAVVFTEHRGEMWAVQVVAPTALWQARRPDVLAILAGVALP